MNPRYEQWKQELRQLPAKWLVTGAAGFIGSHLVETLLRLEQRVVGLDNFSTGFAENLLDVRDRVTDAAWQRFTFFEGDITNPKDCERVCHGVDFVLHQAALGSVPRSIQDPLASHHANVTGFLQMLVAARDAGVRALVYASSSSVYGDHPGLPKLEDQIGEPLSPYAGTKRMNEIYARIFARNYRLPIVGLRYFNAFGRRQSPEGAYAAVIPRWFANLMASQPCQIFGDGETSRDFTHVSNVVQANLLAARAAKNTSGREFNVACGGRLSLNELHAAMADSVRRYLPHLSFVPPRYEPFRAGDIRHSLADIARTRSVLGYEPETSLSDGLDETLEWHIERQRSLAVA